jgi:hypothetical protein
MTAGEAGKPPKSEERIQSAVRNIHAAVGAHSAPGPLADGLAPADRVEIASFVDPDVGRRFQKRLLAAGIMSSITARRRRWQVAVDNEDRQRATEMLTAHLAADPDRRPVDMHRNYDGLILGAFVGVGLSFVMATTMFGNAQMTVTQLVIAVLACTAWGTLCGMLLDFARRSRSAGRRQRFGMRPLLLWFTLLILTCFLVSMF